MLIDNHYGYRKIKYDNNFCLFDVTTNKYVNRKYDDFLFDDNNALSISTYEDALKLINILACFYPKNIFEIRQITYEQSEIASLPRISLSELVLNEISKKYEIPILSIKMLSLVKLYKEKYKFIGFFDYQNESFMINLLFFQKKLESAFNCKSTKISKNVICVYIENLDNIDDLVVDYNARDILNIEKLEWIS